MKEVFEMTYKHIEASRNARLWITTVFAPVATLIVMSPDARHAISNTCKKATNSIKEKLTKKENKKTNTVIELNVNNREEALYALERMTKEIFEMGDVKTPIHKKINRKN